LTSFLTGITEPLEFLFLFVAPFLYLIHAVFDGISFMLAHAFEITIGQTFSGGAIDFFLFGILQGNDRTNWVLVPIIGAGLFVLYYFTFKTLILKFNIMTPGRGAEEVDYSETNVVTDRAEKIIEALGGFDNVTDIDSCATRLRISLKDTSKIDEDALKKTGSRGVVKKGSGVQIIYGPHVTIIKNELEELVS
ncbi:glucose PTS transporter subunit EIIB, partial [Methanocalculus natronophilus]|uniref:glucose PTS transporter subunit EIIB n=1 Tax=Methanocalculus natronophilus TaxID=1262400 RepID=UPI0031B5B4F3